MKNKIKIRKFVPSDKPEVINLWNVCGLTISGNDPEKDIDLKVSFQPDLFFIAEIDCRIIGTVMAGYDGHRGWLNYLGVLPDYRGIGCGRSLVEFSIAKLKLFDCPKLNLQVRNSNSGVINFYKKIGFIEHDVTGMQLKL